MRFIGERSSMNEKLKAMTYHITFIAYRPNSADMSLGVVYDSLDSDLQARDFSSLEKDQARKWLFDLFLADIKLRQNACWIKGLRVMTWVDGRAVIDRDVRCDLESLVLDAHRAAQEQFDHVGA